MSNHRDMSMHRVVALVVFAALAGCSRPAAQGGNGAAMPPVPVAERGLAAGAQSYSGWYMVHGGVGSFRACGAASAWRIAAAGELPGRARAFGMDEDSPVYVRLHGIANASLLDVSTVDQFGSPTPVRDCPMTGVVLSDHHEGGT